MERSTRTYSYESTSDKTVMLADLLHYHSLNSHATYEKCMVHATAIHSNFLKLLQFKNNFIDIFQILIVIAFNTDLRYARIKEIT